MKQRVNAKLVKLSGAGVGVAQIAGSDGPGQYVYFKPRDLDGYRGETWRELESRGLRPGRTLDIEVDRDAAGEVRQVSDVRFSGS